MSNSEKSCDKCRHWGAPLGGDSFAKCEHPKMQREGSPEIDGVSEADANGYDPCIWFGAKFGCIHFESRDKDRLKEIGNATKEPPPEKSMSNKKYIDPANKYIVGTTGEEIRILKPPSQLTANDALIFAAWLVTLAEFKADFTFEEAREAVLST